MSDTMRNHCSRIRAFCLREYRTIFREPGGPFAYPFLAPGSIHYADVLWDWDCWLSNVALRQTLAAEGAPAARADALPHERGCVLNCLAWCDVDGWIPISVGRGDRIAQLRPADVHAENMHKPVVAQHAAFLVREDGGDAGWLRDRFEYLQFFLNNYRGHHRHACGLYYWQTDNRIGVDNDPCTFFRPPRSSGSIFLNCLMYRELEAMVYLCRQLGFQETAQDYHNDAVALHAAINAHCWDERDGFYYSVDLNLLPNEHVTSLHSGMPRNWDCLIQRIGVWSGFLPLWAGLASDEQASRAVEHCRDTRTFNAAFGIRTLSRMEKMYSVRASGNPSNWLGPVWIVSNYLTFRGLLRYGYLDDARELAEKTIRLLGCDLERFGAWHEFYEPDTGEPLMSRGFLNWNCLVMNMIAWLEGEQVVAEF